MSFERAGSTSILNFLGGFEPSRGIDNGSGLGADPVSAGMLPQSAPGTAPPPDVFAPVGLPQAQPTSDTMLAPAQQPIEPPQVHGGELNRIPNGINLDSGVAFFNSRFISLSTETLYTITKVVLDAYEAQLLEEVRALKLEYLYALAPAGQEVRPANPAPAVVRPMPEPESLDDGSGQAEQATEDVRPVPARRRKRRNLLVMSGESTGEEAPTPPA